MLLIVLAMMGFTPLLVGITTDSAVASPKGDNKFNFGCAWKVADRQIHTGLQN